MFLKIKWLSLIQLENLSIDNLFRSTLSSLKIPYSNNNHFRWLRRSQALARIYQLSFLGVSSFQVSVAFIYLCLLPKPHHCFQKHGSQFKRMSKQLRVCRWRKKTLKHCLPPPQKWNDIRKTASKIINNANGVCSSKIKHSSKNTLLIK